MERVDFVVIDSNGPQETLACPNCGCIFEIDAHSQINLIFDRAYKGFVSKCPDCSALQKADDV